MVDLAGDQQTNAVLAWTSAIGWGIVHPIGLLLRYLALIVWCILHLLYRPVAFISQPFVHLGRFFLSCLALPFTLATKFEVSDPK